ncbi:MAG: class I SAM-dependent methyltransferase [Candidatus Adiutrix sp.]|nr:class I SAM-dependent methyltransferase [Candidatus Adiutrix sp.]
MKISDIIDRSAFDEPGEKIPWGDPEFSARMLKHHLAQEHDWASRRIDIIRRQANFLAGRLPPGGRVLDLACGPGFYTHLLAGRGCRCLGVDLSPASIAHARAQAAAEGLAAEYVEADLLDYQAAGPFDCVLFVFGEFNEFSPDEARLILERAQSALAAGGFLLLETHTFEAVRESGQAPPSWWSCPEGQGLLSARPHLCLQENSWDPESARATLSYLIIEAETAGVRLFRSAQTGYAEDQLQNLLTEVGFRPPQLIQGGEWGEWPVGGPFYGRMAAYICPK